MASGTISCKVIGWGIVCMAGETIGGTGLLMIKGGELPTVGDVASNAIACKMGNRNNRTVAASASVRRPLVFARRMAGFTRQLCVLPDQWVKLVFCRRAIGWEGDQLRVNAVITIGRTIRAVLAWGAISVATTGDG